MSEKTVNLPDEAKKLNVQERHQILKENTAKTILSIFIVNNLTVLAIILLIYFTQGNRSIITEGVVMTLIGATTVQVGSAALIIARHLFPGNGQFDQNDT